MSKCRVFGGKTGAIATVWVFVWQDLFQHFGSGSELDLELNRCSGTVADTNWHFVEVFSKTKVDLQPIAIWSVNVESLHWNKPGQWFHWAVLITSRSANYLYGIGSLGRRCCPRYKRQRSRGRLLYEGTELLLRLWELYLQAPIWLSRRCFRVGWQSVFNDFAIHEGMWKCTTSKISTFDISYKTSKWKQICSYMYLMPCCMGYTPDYNWKIKSSSHMAQNTMLNTMPNLLQVISPRILSWMRSDSDLAITSYTTTMAFGDYKSTSKACPADCHFPPTCMILVLSGATIFWRGMTLLESQCLPQMITVQEVQERCTVGFIYHLKRLAAASAPSDESTSELREPHWWTSEAHLQESQQTHPVISDDKLT